MRTPLTATLLIFALATSTALSQGRPAGVSTALVQARAVAETVTIFGQVVASRESAVAARVPGVVEEVMIRVGDQVRAGETLLRLDTELLGIERAEAQAQEAVAQSGLAVAQARLDTAQSSFDRAQALSASATISAAQLDTSAGALAEARGALAEANARIMAARAALARAEYNLDRAQIAAPFDATVLELNTQVGEFITTGTQIALLLDTQTAEVEGNLPSRYAGAITPGLVVSALDSAGQTLELTVRAVLPTEFSATRTRPVRFSMLDGGALSMGQSITIEIPTSAPREVLSVPKDALIQTADGWTAFVHEDGKAVPRTVSIGVALGDSFEVTAGLQSGDEVVVRGNERLRPMQDITPTPAGN